MKNSIKCLLVFILVLSMSFSSSCAPSAEQKDVQDNRRIGDTGKEQEITVKEQVLLDRDGVKVTLKGFDPDALFGPSLEVLVENNNEYSITVQTADVVVNGTMQDTIFSCEVSGGKKANDEITIDQSGLDTAGIEKIKDVEIRFHVVNTDTMDTIFDSELVTVTISDDPSYVQEYDDSGFLAMDKNGVKIVFQKLDNESFWGTEVYVYVENNRDEDIVVQIDEISVNGYMITPIFSCDVLPGKKAFDTMAFLDSDLEENNITSIEEMELVFNVIDRNTWDTIFSSDTITVNFEGQ